MSWKLTKEVRDARHSGLLKNLNLTEFFVLMMMADTCRNDSRIANIGVMELLTLSGHSDRTAISRAIKKLIAADCIKRVTIGNEHHTASYEILTAACCADATPNDDGQDAACCADATCTGDPHVASPIPHVASPTPRVALTQPACCADATHPSSEVTIPTSTPEGERRRASYLPNDWTPTPRTLELLGGLISKDQINLDLDAEADAFRDHYATTTKNAKYRDWDATFRQWVRRSVKFARESRHVNGNGQHQTAHERKTGNHLELINGFATDDQK